MDLTVTQIITRLVAAYLVTTFAAITLESPRTLIFKNWPIGVMSYIVYLIAVHMQVNEFLATFYACFAASIMAQVFARLYFAPVTIFYIPTFFIYVPGSSIYQMAFNLINGDTSQASFYLVQTIMMAGAIALGVFLSDSLVEIYFSTKHKIASKTKRQTQ